MTQTMKQNDQRIAFDSEAFSNYLCAYIYSHGLKKMEAARQSGISHPAFVSITMGRRPSLDSYISICHWMGVSLYKFIATPEVKLIDPQ